MASEASFLFMHKYYFVFIKLKKNAISFIIE